VPKKTSSGKIGDKAIMEKVQSNIICMTAQEHELVHRSADILKGKIKEPNTLFRRLVRFHRWEIFKNQA
jgi:hypothetical protein